MILLPDGSTTETEQSAKRRLWPELCPIPPAAPDTVDLFNPFLFLLLGLVGGAVIMHLMNEERTK